MNTGRLAVAVLTVVCLVAPTAHAQESPAPDQPAVDTQAGAAAVPLKVVQATVTAYASGADGGAIGSLTASGVHTHWGTVAADWRLYPPGTKLQIEGFPDDVFTVEDMGGAVRGNVFDIWFPDLATAVAFGTKSLRVTVLAAAH